MKLPVLFISYIVLTYCLHTALYRAVGSPLLMDPNSICRKSRRLGGKQNEICRKEPEIVREVVKGAKMAVTECQHQFRHRRWNCSTSYKGFGRVLRRGKISMKL